MNNILIIKNLTKNYQTTKEEITAVKNFNLTIKEGEFIAIVGPSGCGKSTVLSILADLEKKSSGEIQLENNIKIGYMLQQDSLFNWRTVLENCLLAIEINKNNTMNKKEVISLLNKYGLKNFINNYPTSLSGGMRQRTV